MGDGPYARLTSVDPGAVHWTEGFWAGKLELCHSVILPSMRRALDVDENGAVFKNLYIAAGLAEGEHQGTNWSDGDCYKWMEAVAHVYGVTGGPALDRMLDERIAVVAGAQDEDGYICTQTQLNPHKERWGARNYHELYNMGHLMTAACVHHSVTGKTSFLAVARKLADYLYRTFQPPPPELAHFAWNPSNIMGLVDLYRATGEPRYLELADIFVTMRGSVPWPRGYGGVPQGKDPHPGDQNQDRVPLRKESEAVGHAVTATYLYCGATDVYAETGDKALFAALDRIWHDVVEKKMYITGGVCPLHFGVSRRGDPVHEAFDLAYHLHSGSAYNETCANIGNGMWNWRMLGVTAEQKYADVMEQVIYNSGLSGISIDGELFCYTNPLRWHGGEHDQLSHDTPERWFTHNCYCCPPQMARTIARMHNWAYSLSEAGVWVHLYGGSTIETDLSGGSLKLVQESDYPWDGAVKIVLERAPGIPFSLMLRIPAWAHGEALSVNGQNAGEEVQPGTYVALERAWATGDSVVLTLPLEPRLIKAHRKVEEARNQVALMRGPVVYCVESVDLPEDVSVSEIHIPRNVRLSARYDRDLLGGVVVLEGEARRVYEETPSDALYSPFGEETVKTIDISLIPYYAWNNRGPTEMTVWMPVYWE